MRRWNCSYIATLAVSAAACSAQAGMFDDVVEGLRFAGFALDQQHIDLTNSDFIIAAHDFQGNAIDLGDFNVAMAGPVSLVLERGGRNIPELSFTLSTGLLNVNANRVVSVGAPEPLAYTLNFDSGTNETIIAGNMLFDLRGKINKFGSYDLKFQSSNRQTTLVDGRFDEVPIGSADFDIGPIDIEGNIFADLLATLTDPFFQATGGSNIFADFSGRTFREEQARTTIDALRSKVEAGGTLTESELASLTAIKFTSDLLGDDVPNLDFVGDGLPADLNASVPEPASGLLLLAGGAVMLVRRRR